MYRKECKTYNIGRFIFLIIWITVIFILSILPTKNLSTPITIPHLDKVAHWGMFFIFAIFSYEWIHYSLHIRKRHIILIIILSTTIYGGIIEWLQEAYFFRTADFYDWLADIFGSICGIFSYPILSKWRQKLTNFNKMKEI